MDSNKVMNSKEDVLPNENGFNDEDILNDILISIKSLNTVFGIMKQEASNKSLCDIIEKQAKTIGNLGRQAFNLMFEKGWYELEKESTQKLNEVSTKFQKKEQIISQG